jgi:hypothetical protein
MDRNVLKWYGHVKKMEDVRAVKSVYGEVGEYLVVRGWPKLW